MSDDNVVGLKPASVGENFIVEPDKVLNAAVGELQQAIVIGYGNDGSLYVASSHGVADTGYLIDLAKRHMLNETAAIRGWD